MLNNMLDEFGEAILRDFDPSVEDVDLPEEEDLERRIAEKIRFTWRSEDEVVLARIEGLADEKFAEAFAAVTAEVDRLYETIYTPRYRNNARVVDNRGRQMWETGEDGRPIENWDDLCGQDFERCLMNLQRIKMLVAPEVNKLKNRAMFAKMSSGDVKDDAWKTVMSGTTGDKEARVNRQSRQDRYFAFFQYALWSTGDTFEKEVLQFMRRLEKISDWRVWSKR